MSFNSSIFNSGDESDKNYEESDYEESEIEEKEYDYDDKGMILKNMYNYIANYCYMLVNKNRDLLDLTKYDKKHRFLIENLDKYIISQPNFKTELSILREIYNHHTYVDIETIINILDNNIIELNNKYVDYIHILILSNDTIPNKSNFFFYLYFLKRYEEITGKRIRHIFENIYHFLKLPDCLHDSKINIYKYLAKDYPLDKKYVLIYCDDISYSGSQLINNIIYNHDKKCKINLVDNIKIYFNIFGVTRTAMSLFNHVINKNSIIIPEHTKKYDMNIQNILYKVSKINPDEEINDELRNFIIENDIYKIIKEEKYSKDKIVDYKYYITRGDLGDLFYYSFIEPLDKSKDIMNLKLSLIYIDFKYPDNVSTIPNLCRLNTINDNEYYIDYKKFIDTYKDTKIFTELYEYHIYNVDITDLIKSYNYKIDTIPWIKKGDKNLDDLLYLDNNTKNYLQLINNFDKKEKYMNDYYTSCNKYSIVPFYKSLLYKDINNLIYDRDKSIMVTFNEYIMFNNKYITNKYHKYKNKYLKTKI